MPRYRFGDIAKEVKVNINRANNPYEFYVAGDHMDTDSLEIRRRGTFANSDVGPAFIRLFEPGQILYGSRRTYLKKVAVADFAGITSNTTFVIEAKDETIFLHRLLPFLMLSEGFTEHSIRNSKGSTNPYILFSDLAQFEVNVPPIEQQHEIADILWAYNDAKNAYLSLVAATDALVKSQFIGMFGDSVTNTHGLKKSRLGEVCVVERGGSPRPISEYVTDSPDGLNWIKIGDADESRYITRTAERIKPEGLRKTRQVYVGDLILSNSMSFGHPYILKIDGCIHDGWLVLHFDDKTFDPLFLQAYLGLPSTYAMFASMAAGGVVNNLNSEIVRKTPVLVPPIEDQHRYADFVESTDKSKFALQQNIERLDMCRNALMQKAFS